MSSLDISEKKVSDGLSDKLMSLKTNLGFCFLQACQFGYYPSCLSAGLLDSANPYSEVIKILSRPILLILRFL